MNKRKKILVISIGIIAFMGFLIFGIVVASSSDSARSTTTFLPASMIAALLPLYVAIISNLSPATPVNYLISAITVEKHSIEKKKANLEYYVSKDFISTGKLDLLLNENFSKAKSNKVKGQTKEQAVVEVNLINGNSFEFQLIKSTKDNRIKGIGTWVIDNYIKLLS